MEKYFIEGPIPSQLIAETITNQQSKTNIGGHAIFLGQVRADVTDGKSTSEIIYSAYNEMASNEFQAIETQMLEKYDDLKDIIIKHSLGAVKSGEASLFVFISSGHRVQAFEAIKETVNLIKAKVPIWKKEILEDNSHIWSENH